MYALVLDIKADTDKWIKDIGFKNPKHYTKVKIWKKFGFCPPNTKIMERKKILNNEINPYSYYKTKKEKIL